ncbi:two-component system, OmpR family, phosphate regulon sensor histidine kinase PhoR [Mariprofundus ferrinatatus]|uniref:histidine kinase n=2 Tax=Mariprofundus ferrinatatus TaxID=1921087 RepID=A0A2K8L6H8_9PROT|nr:two-component system, OmpR family, phosphate regulon sensor histidine kinase PhoR [Mariprofundus ferrinatatus]
MLGYAPGEIAPHVSSWEYLVHPDDMPEVMQVLQQHLDGKIDSYETTHRVKNKEGEWQWIQDRGKIVEYDNNGSPLRAVGTHLDVSGRIKTEQSLAKRTDQLERANLELDEILNISPVGFMSFGANNISTFYTPRFAALVNINDKILGISIGKAKQHIIDNNKLLPARPEQDTNEFIIYNREADKVIKIRTTSSGSQSQPAQLMAAIDITQEHNLDRMKTYFMSAASHELRTPLSSVCGFSELLLESADLFSRDEQKEMLRSIYTQAMSLSAIVTQLLDVSRIESGLKPTPHPETFDLSKHIAQLISAFTPRERNHSIEYACGEACEINSDPEFINRIITNLLSNACKYSEHGLTVEIALKRQQLKERDGYAIRITDHGIGMAKEDREKVFDKFFRADKSRKVQGMGLGLHITRQLTDALQGFVCLDAGEDGGTVAHIWLPEEIEEKSDA